MTRGASDLNAMTLRELWESNQIPTAAHMTSPRTAMTTCVSPCRAPSTVSGMQMITNCEDGACYDRTVMIIKAPTPPIVVFCNVVNDVPRLLLALNVQSMTTTCAHTGPLSSSGEVGVSMFPKLGPLMNGHAVITI